MEDHGYHSMGKYSSARDDILHYLCTSDWANASNGSTESPVGYFWEISNTPEDVSANNGEFNSVMEEWFNQNPEVTDSGFLRAELVGHFIVQQMDSGFVYVFSYGTEKEMMDAAYEEMENEYAEWDQSDD